MPLPVPFVLRRLRRHPVAYWAVAAAVSLGTGVAVARTVESAEAEAARLGGLRPALVAAADLPAGHRIEAGDVTTERLPEALLPREPASGDAAAVGSVLADAVAAGQVLSERDLAPHGLSPVAARLGAGRVGVAVPGGPGGLPVTVGDVVDVYATFAPEIAGDGEPTFAVARAATVVDVSEDAVTVAVRDGEVAPVAFAVAQGVVTLALTRG